MSRKLLLCLPFAPHEIQQARELLKLWCDLEDGFNDYTTLLIASRFDIKPEAIGQDIIDYAKKKFKVLTHRNSKVGTGWPAGCNALEVGVYEWFVESNRNKRIDFEYILLAEADTVPTRKGWLKEIMDEAYDNKSLILGAYFVAADGIPHINGNCVIHRDFWKKCRHIWLINPHIGWDVAIGPAAIKWGTPSKLIWQDYQLGLPNNPWKGDDHLFSVKVSTTKTNPLYGKELYPAMFHGVKVMRGIEAVRRKIFGEK